MTPATGAAWARRVPELDAVLEDRRAFKAMLGIGSDAYRSTRFLKIMDASMISLSAGGVGAAAASSSVVASTFFPVGGLLGWLGLGAAVTPVGWVLVGAVAAAGGVGLLRTLARKLQGPVEVIPRFINTPLDLLAASLLDVMMPIVLKVALADGEIHADERTAIEAHFVRRWGYTPAYVSVLFDCAHADIASIPTATLVDAFAIFCRDSPDTNFPVIRLDLETFLQDLIEADRQITEPETAELNQIRSAFENHKTARRVTWTRVPWRTAKEASNPNAPGE